MAEKTALLHMLKIVDHMNGRAPAPVQKQLTDQQADIAEMKKRLAAPPPPSMTTALTAAVGPGIKLSDWVSQVDKTEVPATP